MSPPVPRRSRIEALLLDVEGVIAHPDNVTLDERLKAFAPGIDAEMLDAARNTPRTYALWEAYSCGRLSRAEYWGPILDELGLTSSSLTIRLISAAQRDSWWAQLRTPVLEVARTARRSVRTGLLSNSAPEHEAHIPRFAGGFDVACFSHRMGLRKPDREAYLEAARRLECEPAAIVFVDDKQRNVDAAGALGMIGIRFKDPISLADEVVAAGIDIAGVDIAGVDIAGVDAAEDESAGVTVVGVDVPR